MDAHKRAGVVLGGAVGVVGVTFGVLATTAGLSTAKAMAMSAFVFTGASQFAAVGIVDGGGSEIAAVASGLLLAARNSLYGMRLSQLTRRAGRARIPAAHMVIDETTAMATAQRDEQKGWEAFVWTGLSLFVFWNLGTLLGAQLGSVVGDPDRWGLDAVFPASFVALLAPQVASLRGRIAAASGVIIALVAVPFTPAGAPILLAALAVVPALAAPTPTETSS